MAMAANMGTSGTSSSKLSRIGVIVETSAYTARHITS
jgi:hypothetical protein